MSVIVPSYRRPHLLTACLQGLAEQARPAWEVVVVRRRDDLETAEVVRTSPVAVVEALVEVPGVLAAMEAGVVASTGDVVAFTDDDAVPRPDWVGGLARHYAAPDVGGVGGRDVTQPRPLGEQTLPSSAVGRVTAWGRHLGFHHVGEGPPVDVDVLKGVNMSFRREAYAVPVGLLGDGAQVHHELASSLWARSRGWRLVYDPAVVVDHFHGPRFDKDQRQRPAAVAVRNEAYNLVMSLVSQRPAMLLRRAAFGLLVGDRATPGIVRVLAGAALRQQDVLRKALPSLAGQLRALLDVLRGRTLRMRSFEPAG